METRVIDLKRSSVLPRPNVVSQAKLDWFDVLHFFFSVLAASGIHPTIPARFLPGVMNNESFKMAITATIIFIVSRQFQLVFFT